MNLKPTTRLALDWAIRCFGINHVYNVPVRSLRLAEEAVELTQAVGIPKEKMHDLVDIVYARPHGDPFQEICGVAMTLAIMGVAFSETKDGKYTWRNEGSVPADPEDYLLAELRRVLSKHPDHFTQRNQEKIDLGLDAAKYLP